MYSHQLKALGVVFTLLALGLYANVDMVHADDDDVTELSVEPTSAIPEGDVRSEATEDADALASDLADDDPGEAAAGPSGVFHQSLTRSPLLWAIIGLVLLIVGGKTGYGLISKWAQKSSAGEVFGSFTMVGGLFTIANAAGLCFDWSLPITNMFVAGFVAMVFGIGIAASSNEKRKVAEKK